jgi:hypothetical protein
MGGTLLNEEGKGELMRPNPIVPDRIVRNDPDASGQKSHMNGINDDNSFWSAFSYRTDKILRNNACIDDSPVRIQKCLCDVRTNTVIPEEVISNTKEQIHSYVPLPPDFK